jgi:GNAT superfamily N-acetyltransferase
VIEIVEAGRERLDDIEPLWHALVEHQGPLLPALGPARERADAWARRRAHYEALLAKEGAFVLIAERDGRPVGYVTVEPSSPSQTWQLDAAATIETLLVLPEERGAGIGSRLLEAVRERVRAAGATHLGLGVVATNEGALRFYRRHGFAPAFVEMIAALQD